MHLRKFLCMSRAGYMRTTPWKLDQCAYFPESRVPLNQGICFKHWGSLICFKMYALDEFLGMKWTRSEVGDEYGDDWPHTAAQRLSVGSHAA